MKTEIKKKLLNDFKQRKIIGGICAIKNNVNGKILLENSYNIESNRNRFEFSKKIGSAVSLKMQKDWYLYGAEAFTFEVLEELTKDDNQTMEEFIADINTLREMWDEKLNDAQLY